MQTLAVAAIQLTSGNQWHENLLEVKRLVAKAAKDGARLVVLPENVFLFDGKGMRGLAESEVQDELLSEVKSARQEFGYLSGNRLSSGDTYRDWECC